MAAEAQEGLPPVSRRDVLLAAGLAVVQCLGLLVQGQDAGLGIDRGPDAVGLGLVALSAVPLAWRRRRPVVALAGCAVPLVLAAALGYGPAVSQLTLTLAIASAAVHGSRRSTIAIAATGMAGALVLLVALGEDPGAVDVLSLAALIVLPAAIGDAVRTERRRAALARATAAGLERLRATEIERALEAERVRLARDIHDIVGHHLSAIAIQVNAARRSLGRDPEAEAASLDHIGDLAERALRETRQALGHVRVDGAASRSPQPGLADLDMLVADAARRGLTVEQHHVGIPGDVDPAVQTCAYRVVQEALTNVSRHGAPTATLTLSHRPGLLEIEIRDPGRPGPPPPASEIGTGLIGMRERVILTGGALRAGPEPEHGGWSVHAQLPAGAP